MQDIDYMIWLKKCTWCPNPISCAQLQVPIQLVSYKGRLCVGRSDGRVIARLHNRDADFLLPVLEAGYEVEIDIMDSIPDKRRVLISVFVDGEQLDEDEPDQQATGQATHQEHTPQQRAEQWASIRRLMNVLLKLLASAINHTYRSVIKAAKSIPGLWRVLVEWTNK